MTEADFPELAGLTPAQRAFVLRTAANAARVCGVLSPEELDDDVRVSQALSGVLRASRQAGPPPTPDAVSGLDAVMRDVADERREARQTMDNARHINAVAEGALAAGRGTPAALTKLRSALVEEGDTVESATHRFSMFAMDTTRRTFALLSAGAKGMTKFFRRDAKVYEAGKLQQRSLMPRVAATVAAIAALGAVSFSSIDTSPAPGMFSQMPASADMRMGLDDGGGARFWNAFGDHLSQSISAFGIQSAVAAPAEAAPAAAAPPANATSAPAALTVAAPSHTPEELQAISAAAQQAKLAEATRAVEADRIATAKVMAETRQAAARSVPDSFKVAAHAAPPHVAPHVAHAAKPAAPMHFAVETQDPLAEINFDHQSREQVAVEHVITVEQVLVPMSSIAEPTADAMLAAGAPTVEPIQVSELHRIGEAPDVTYGHDKDTVQTVDQTAALNHAASVAGATVADGAKIVGDTVADGADAVADFFTNPKPAPYAVAADPDKEMVHTVDQTAALDHAAASVGHTIADGAKSVSDFFTGAQPASTAVAADHENVAAPSAPVTAAETAPPSDAVGTAGTPTPESIQVSEIKISNAEPTADAMLAAGAPTVEPIQVSELHRVGEAPDVTYGSDKEVVHTVDQTAALNHAASVAGAAVADGAKAVGHTVSDGADAVSDFFTNPKPAPYAVAADTDKEMVHTVDQTAALNHAASVAGTAVADGATAVGHTIADGAKSVADFFTGSQTAPTAVAASYDVSAPADLAEDVPPSEATVTAETSVADPVQVSEVKIDKVEPIADAMVTSGAPAAEPVQVSELHQAGETHDVTYGSDKEVVHTVDQTAALNHAATVTGAAVAGGAKAVGHTVADGANAVADFFTNPKPAPYAVAADHDKEMVHTVDQTAALDSFITQGLAPTATAEAAPVPVQTLAETMVPHVNAQGVAVQPPTEEFRTAIYDFYTKQHPDDPLAAGGAYHRALTTYQSQADAAGGNAWWYFDRDGAVSASYSGGDSDVGMRFAPNTVMLSTRGVNVVRGEDGQAQAITSLINGEPVTRKPASLAAAMSEGMARQTATAVPAAAVRAAQPTAAAAPSPAFASHLVGHLEGLGYSHDAAQAQASGWVARFQATGAATVATFHPAGTSGRAGSIILDGARNTYFLYDRDGRLADKGSLAPAHEAGQEANQEVTPAPGMRA